MEVAEERQGGQGKNHSCVVWTHQLNGINVSILLYTGKVDNFACVFFAFCNCSRHILLLYGNITYV